MLSYLLHDEFNSGEFLFYKTGDGLNRENKHREILTKILSVWRS